MRVFTTSIVVLSVASAAFAGAPCPASQPFVANASEYFDEPSLGMMDDASFEAEPSLGMMDDASFEAEEATATINNVTPSTTRSCPTSASAVSASLTTRPCVTPNSLAFVKRGVFDPKDGFPIQMATPCPTSTAVAMPSITAPEKPGDVTGMWDEQVPIPVSEAGVDDTSRANTLNPNSFSAVAIAVLAAIII